MKILTRLLLGCLVCATTGRADTIPAEFFDNEDSVNSVLECVASAEVRGNLDEGQDCQEKCEDIVPLNITTYKVCKNSCREVYND